MTRLIPRIQVSHGVSGNACDLHSVVLGSEDGLHGQNLSLGYHLSTVTIILSG